MLDADATYPPNPDYVEPAEPSRRTTVATTTLKPDEN